MPTRVAARSRVRALFKAVISAGLYMFLLMFVASRSLAQGTGDDSLKTLRQGQLLEGFRVAHLYQDSEGSIVGAKMYHIHSGAPVHVLQIETAPQVFMWVDTPARSDQGLAHSLEHLLAGKGTKGRYSTLLTSMRLSHSESATISDFNFFGFSSGTGMQGFFEQFDAWLDALYHPDFSDLEAQRELYHLSVASATDGRRRLIESGTVYDEELSNQGVWMYYYALNKRLFGDNSPFGFDPGGIPEQMRSVTPAEVRRFYLQHYQLGPSTGFIFAIDPRENVHVFLQRVSQELSKYATAGNTGSRKQRASAQPKYPIQPSPNKAPAVYPFPSNDLSSPGEVRLAWPCTRTRSPAELKLLDLFFRALAGDERSLLHRRLVDSTTRQMNSEVTSVSSGLFLADSPWFPCPTLGLSGIPGNHITVEKLESLRQEVTSAIVTISSYQEGSPELSSFNGLCSSWAHSLQRSEKVWARDAPLFGFLGSGSRRWKEHLDQVDMSPDFVQPLSDDTAWAAVDEKLRSSRNIWRDLVAHFELLQTPYISASAPSTEELQQLRKAERERISSAEKKLQQRFGTHDTQKALSRFEREELAKTAEVQKVEPRVPRPAFTHQPPLTPDDDLQFRETTVNNSVPVIETLFERPPTLDVGLSFDLNGLPEKYYKYLPLLPSALRELGLRKQENIVSYADLLTRIEEEVYKYSAAYESNALSKRADLTVRISAADLDELHRALLLAQDLIRFNDTNLANLKRLQDVVGHLRSRDDLYTRQAETNWIEDPAYSFRYQENGIYLALNSHFTIAHWDDRLSWLLHDPVSPEQVQQLEQFADQALVNLAKSPEGELQQKLTELPANGLEAEMLAYWIRNLASFPDGRRIEGLRALAAQVSQDLKQGPASAIAELEALERLVFTRERLRISLMGDQKSLQLTKPYLASFIDSLGEGKAAKYHSAPSSPVSKNLRERYPDYKETFPQYLAFVTPSGNTADVVFTSEFPGYTNLDKASLQQVLASNLFAGAGPQTFFMKTWEAGLAYSNGIAGDPSSRLLLYYADRSSDIPALLDLVQRTAGDRSQSFENSVDYALSQVFPLPRSMFGCSQRAKEMVWDIRDGLRPATVRPFFASILKLRSEPDLASRLSAARLSSIAGVLLNPKAPDQQQSTKSLYFFLGPATVIRGLERHLALPNLYWVWPSDYWIDD